MRRLTILLAAVGMLMLIPTAHAFARDLQVTIEGTGGGDVSSAGGYSGTGIWEGTPAIECSYASPGPATGVCENELEENPVEPGAEVTMLTAKADPGSKFVGWVVTQEVEGTLLAVFCGENGGKGAETAPGAYSCGPGSLSGVNSEFPVEAIATFQKESPPLTLNIEEGQGTVVSNPAGLECTGSAPKSCEAEVGEGLVTLTASPAAGYLFKSWKGCDSGGVNGRQCKVTLSSAKTVGAKFVKAFDLSVAKAGAGKGKIQSAPGGVLCLEACTSTSAAFKEGSVTVKAAPSKHQTFVQWLGDCSGSSPECSVNMNEDREVEAEFATDPQYLLSVSKEGGGQGSIKSKPAGIGCGYTCTDAAASLYSGEVVAITVALNKGTSSVTWTTPAGTCTGSALTCTVTMSEAKSLVAKFE